MPSFSRSSTLYYTRSNLSNRSTRYLQLLGLLLGLLLTLPMPAASALLTDPAALLKNINTTTNQSNPSYLTPIGSIVYFVASDGMHGNELWKTDGTEAGTVLVADLTPGSAGTSFQMLAAVDATLFFVDRAGDQYRLWRSNGTQAGTMFVAALESEPRSLTSYHGALFFGTNQHLWRSDSIQGETMAIAAMNVSSIAVSGNSLFIVSGQSLWRSDGTQAGTKLLVSLSGTVQDLTDVNGSLFFDVNGEELWHSGGTAASTQRLHTAPSSGCIQEAMLTSTSDVRPGLCVPFDTIRNLTNVNGTLFFSSSEGLWKSNGTPAGTVAVNSSVQVGELAGLAGQVVFTVRLQQGLELWHSGTNPNTSARLAILGLGWDDSAHLTVVDNTIFLVNNDAAHGRELWKSDGTAAGTTLVKDVALGNADPRELIAADHILYFVADNEQSYGELWRSDGSAAGTHIVRDINRSESGSTPRQFVISRNKLFFFATVGTTYGLWSSDGTPSGTALVKRLAVDSTLQLIDVGGNLFFSSSAAGQAGLWTSDGTAAGTRLLKAGVVVAPREIQGKVWFLAENDLNSIGLWTSDGTEAGTVRIGELPFGPLKSSYFCQPDWTTVGTTVLFALGFSNQPCTSLWRSDGTTAGTRQIATPGATYIGSLTAHAGALYFITPFVTPTSLWRSDGTDSGTTRVTTIPSTLQLDSVNGQLMFVTFDTIQAELWASDGTVSGTRRVAILASTGQIIAGSAQSGGTFFIMLRPVLCCDALIELWRTDGTAQNTALVQRFNATGSTALKLVEGTLVFGVGGGTDAGLWTSDGMPSGTHRLQLFREIQEITTLGTVLFVSADDGAVGTELWAIHSSPGAEVHVSAPRLNGGAPEGVVFVPLTYGNGGFGMASNVQVTLELDPALSYVSDSSGVVPTIAGNKVTWKLPNTSALVQRQFNVAVRLPNAAIGRHYPLHITIDGLGPASQTTHAEAASEVFIARQTFLPLARW